MLLASIPPSAAPAPTTVCISSIKTIISPLADLISSITAFKRSSNSPLNLLPATKVPMSIARTFRFFSSSGTSPFTIASANPSAIAVLPTPAPPIKTGLFFVFRSNVCIALFISRSLPITGSKLPCFANSVRSTLYLSSEP